MTPTSFDTSLLQRTWFDSAWIPSLNQQNVLDYFSQRSNPFYDRTCNNEVIKMQRADPEQLKKMTGVEYMLLHVQDPILYVIRKVHRQTMDRVTPLADYYILGGVVYQCPDLWSVINSRMLSTLHLVHEAFSEIISYERYDPSKGYSWEFPNESPKKSKGAASKTQTRTEQPNEEQRRRVDMLLTDLVQTFPPKAFGRRDGGKPIVVEDKPEENKEQVQRETSNLKRPAPHTGTEPPDTKRKRVM